VLGLVTPFVVGRAELAQGGVPPMRVVEAFQVVEDRVGGEPEALLANQGRLYAAVVELGIVSSADGGRSWQLRYREGQPAG
jgi:hypothetical protein